MYIFYLFFDFFQIGGTLDGYEQSKENIPILHLFQF